MPRSQTGSPATLPGQHYHLPGSETRRFLHRGLHRPHHLLLQRPADEPRWGGFGNRKRPRHCRVRLRPLAVRPAMPPSLGGGGLSQLPPGRRAVDHARVGAAILVLCAMPGGRGRRGGAPHGRRDCCAVVHVGRVCVLHWNGGARVSAQPGIEAV